RPGGVDYLVYSYENQDKLVNGEDYVASAYTSLHYLQPQIRGIQGAYGSGMSVAMPYRMSLYTYRDPDYRQSMTQIEQMSQVLQADMTQEKLDAAKTEALGVVQRQYQLLGSLADQAEVLQKMSIMEMKPDTITKVQRQVVGAKLSRIQSKLDQIDQMIQESRIGICTQRNKAPRDFKGIIYE
ncbi:MAG: hypothetical protein ACRCTE_10165, partial [Cellulosilyticaceae bacterium]